MNTKAIQEKNFKVAIDAVNSTGGIAIPKLLQRLGVIHYDMYCEPNGHFPHNPEPLKEHLGDICKKVIDEQADFGIVVDPDVDRLAIIDEKGEMFGEEYTLVAVADYVLSKTPSATVVPGKITDIVAITAKSSTVTPISVSLGGCGSFVRTTYGKIQTKFPILLFCPICTLL